MLHIARLRQLDMPVDMPVDMYHAIGSTIMDTTMVSYKIVYMPRSSEREQRKIACEPWKNAIAANVELRRRLMVAKHGVTLRLPALNGLGEVRWLHSFAPLAHSFRQ